MRHLHAQVAAGHHNAVGRLKDFIEVLQSSDRSILAMTNGCAAEGSAAARTAAMSAAVSTNDWLTASTPLARANSRHGVVVGEGADTQIDAGQIQPLPRTQLTAHGHPAVHVAARDMFHQQLNEPVVEEQPVAGLHHPRQVFEAHRDALPVPTIRPRSV